MSEAKNLGDKLVAMCKEGKNMDAVRELYADDAVSVEAMAMPGLPREMKGKEAILGKGAWWYDNHEIHGGDTQGPFPHGEDRFAVIFDVDCTFKPEKRRTQLREVGLYTVKGGKIVREEFFYAVP